MAYFHVMLFGLICKPDDVPIVIFFSVSSLNVIRLLGRFVHRCFDANIMMLDLVQGFLIRLNAEIV